MIDHPALTSGRTAVITGAASGIGFAAARRFAQRGMRVVMSDINAAALESAAAAVASVAVLGTRDVLAVSADVSRLDDVQRLKDAYDRAFGDVAVLMNNAGTAPGGGPWDSYDRWRVVLDVNLWGVIHGVQVFTQAMIDHGRPAAIVNTGSKQGITCPPGDTAYNVSKAGVKVLTEALAHGLRNVSGCQVSAHLLVPGSTYTGMTNRGAAEKPAGMWTPDQVVDALFAAMAANDFYVICPDNEVTREVDNLRIRWAAEDVIRNRPPLSRWHPDYKDAFAEFLRHGLQEGNSARAR
jgi:NAD(P)-dependent dehydrogenase (short-subunit alcohol dehydrogenase family)